MGGAITSITYPIVALPELYRLLMPACALTINGVGGMPFVHGNKNTMLEFMHWHACARRIANSSLSNCECTYCVGCHV